jgi:hypothetical protein
MSSSEKSYFPITRMVAQDHPFGPGIDMVLSRALGETGISAAEPETVARTGRSGSGDFKVTNNGIFPNVASETYCIVTSYSVPPTRKETDAYPRSSNEGLRRRGPQRFEDEMVVHSREFNPPLCKVLGEEQLRVALRAAIKRAGNCGFTHRGPSGF